MALAKLYFRLFVRSLGAPDLSEEEELHSDEKLAALRDLGIVSFNSDVHTQCQTQRPFFIEAKSIKHEDLLKNVAKTQHKSIEPLSGLINTSQVTSNGSKIYKYKTSDEMLDKFQDRPTIFTFHREFHETIPKTKTKIVDAKIANLKKVIYF